MSESTYKTKKGTKIEFYSEKEIIKVIKIEGEMSKDENGNVIDMTNFAFDLTRHFNGAEESALFLYSLPKGEYLARINDVYDYIDNNSMLHRKIGKIQKYNGEEIRGEYITSTGTLTQGCTVWYILDEDKEEIKQISISSFDLEMTHESSEEADMYTGKSIISSYKGKQGTTTYFPFNFSIRYIPSDEEPKALDTIIITNKGKLEPFGLTIDYNQTDLPLMAEAQEANQTLAGVEGDMVFETKYGARIFDIVAFTDDYLSATEKEKKREEIRQFLNSIKNKTVKLKIQPLMRTFEVKYNGTAEDKNYPMSVQFTIPLKSSSPYAISSEKFQVTKAGEFYSDTVKDVGFVCTIEGPTTYPKMTLNDNNMSYSSIIAEGTKLIIDTRKCTVTHISKTGTKTNAMSYYNHVFPKIQNGMNKLEFSNYLSNAKVKIEWNDLLL